MLEHLTHNPEIKGLNPAAGICGLYYKNILTIVSDACTMNVFYKHNSWLYEHEWCQNYCRKRHLNFEHHLQSLNYGHNWQLKELKWCRDYDHKWHNNLEHHLQSLFWGCIFIHVWPVYEQAVSNLETHRGLCIDLSRSLTACCTQLKIWPLMILTT